MADPALVEDKPITVELIRRFAAERRERGQKHDAIVHAALFDGFNVRVVEKDGREHVGSPIISPGAYESIGVRTVDDIVWFHASNLADVEAVPAQVKYAAQRM